MPDMDPEILLVLRLPEQLFQGATPLSSLPKFWKLLFMTVALIADLTRIAKNQTTVFEKQRDP